MALLTWKKSPGAPGIQAPISHGGDAHDYVISHRTDQHTVSYRPPGKHEHVGTFSTEKAAKAAAEVHAAASSPSSAPPAKKTDTQVKREITEFTSRGIPRAEATALIKQIRDEVRRIGADVTVGRSGTGKYQLIELWGADANAVAAQLEQRGFRRTALRGLGTKMSPITLSK